MIIWALNRKTIYWIRDLLETKLSATDVVFTTNEKYINTRMGNLSDRIDSEQLYSYYFNLVLYREIMNLFNNNII